MVDTQNTLTQKSSKETREGYKDLAVKAREKGNLDQALKMLDEIIAWDEHNDNLRGKMDILGHKKIALTLMSDNSNNDQEKTKLLNEALNCTTEALEIGKTLDIPAGTLAIQKVHLASLYIKQAETVDVKSKSANLRKAVEILDAAIVVFPGSEAHKAWPLGIKARALYLLGQNEKALEILQQAQTALYKGYEGEVKGADQAAMKLRVWNSGIMLGFAEIYAGNNKPILAEVYAQAVLQTPDPDGVLVARKKQAKQILEGVR